jgi:hypothetical protein
LRLDRGPNDAWGDHSRYLRRYSAWDIVKVVLYRRLAAIVIVVALFGANTAMASVCEACCAGAGEKNTDHHHQITIGFSSPHHNTHAQEHRADCPECPKSVRRSSLRRPDCGSFNQVLRDDSRVFSDERAVSQIDAADSSTSFLPIPIESERFSPFHSPPKISGFEPILVSLRI